MIFLARQPPGKLSGAHEISTAQRLPKPFLWKVLRKLHRGNLIRAFRGIGGGYELACPARRIYLSDIFAAAGDGPSWQNCLFGFSECPKHKPCPLHSTCTRIRKDFQRIARQCTIADLAGIRGNSHFGR